MAYLRMETIMYNKGHLLFAAYDKNPMSLAALQDSGIDPVGMGFSIVW